MLGQRAGVDAHAQRRAALLGQGDHLGDLLRSADVAGVQAHAVSARFDRLQRERVVEVDVGDHRDRRLRDDRLQRLGVLLARHRDAHDVRARLRDRPDLLHRRLQVGGLGLGHRLHRHGRAAADRDSADVDLAFRGHRLDSRCPSVYATAAGPLARLAGPAAARARARRHARFFGLARLPPGGTVLDVGCGVLGLRAQEPELDDHRSSTSPSGPPTRARSCARTPPTGCRSPSDAFDLVYCSSVIEHVEPARRAAFAAELRRVGRGWFVQTPAFGFPLEPHSLLPGAHWLRASSTSLLLAPGSDRRLGRDRAATPRGARVAVRPGAARALRPAGQELGVCEAGGQLSGSPTRQA